MALEQTVNKDCKSSGGVIGFTQSEQTLSRWLITRHLMGEYANKTKELITHKMKSCRSYGSTERIREEEDVKKMETLIEETWINPFDPSHFSTDLIHIATGKIASAEVRNSLSNFKEKANSSNEKFAKDRLTFDNVVSFWQPVPRDNLKAFGNDTVGYKKTGKQNYVNSDFMFRRVLCAAQYKDMDFADIMSYELTAVPVSIFHEDGTMRKTAKSDLATKFETYGPTMFESPSEIDSYFIDGMILLQEMNPKSFRTFQELGEVLMNKMIRIFKEHQTCRTISIIFDRYDLENSIKSGERIRRGQHKIGTYSINGSRNVPNYNIFLKSTSNKMSLIKFVTKYFIESHLRLPTNNEIIIAGGLEDAQICVKIHHSGTTEEPHLRCNHEEADTRLILHISTQRNSKIIIKSDGTDVFVLLLYYYWNDDNVRSNTIYMEKGHGTAYTNRRRFVAIHDVARTLKKRTCDGLPAFHVLTGCDTTSSFFKIGKKSAWDIYLKKKENLCLDQFGMENFEKSEEIARKFVLYLYKQENCQDLNQARLILSKNSKKSAREIPPTEDAFNLHVKRCYYQISMWINSHVGLYDQQDPKEFGWQKEEGHNYLLPKLMCLPQIPDNVRKIIDLHCNDAKCIQSKCICKKEGMFCTDECKCRKSCSNIEEEHVEIDEAETFFEM